MNTYPLTCQNVNVDVDIWSYSDIGNVQPKAPPPSNLLASLVSRLETTKEDEQ